LEAWR